MEMAINMASSEFRAKADEVLRIMESDPVTARIMDAAETVEEMYEAARRYVNVKFEDFKRYFNEAMGCYEAKMELSDDDMELVVGGSWKSFWQKTKKFLLSATVIVSCALGGAVVGAIGGAVVGLGEGGPAGAAVGAAVGAVAGIVGGVKLGLEVLDQYYNDTRRC
ncbi:MAG: hypothetical protein ACI3U2_00995 [Anaerovibrio sp.]